MSALGKEVGLDGPTGDLHGLQHDDAILHLHLAIIDRVGQKDRRRCVGDMLRGRPTGDQLAAGRSAKPERKAFGARPAWGKGWGGPKRDRFGVRDRHRGRSTRRPGDGGEHGASTYQLSIIESGHAVLLGALMGL